MNWYQAQEKASKLVRASQFLDIQVPGRPWRLILDSDRGVTCTCPAFQWSGFKPCKHMMAAVRCGLLPLASVRLCLEEWAVEWPAAEDFDDLDGQLAELEDFEAVRLHLLEIPKKSAVLKRRRARVYRAWPRIRHLVPDVNLSRNADLARAESVMLQNPELVENKMDLVQIMWRADHKEL